MHDDTVGYVEQTLDTLAEHLLCCGNDIPPDFTSWLFLHTFCPLVGASNKGGNGNELFSIALCVNISKKVQD